MKELTPEQQREYDRLLSEEPAVSRGRNVALGLMVGVEGSAFGAAAAYALGAFWAVGSVVGLVVAALLGLVWRLVPRERRLRWAARNAFPVLPQVDNATADRVMGIEGARLHRDPKKPYSPQ